MNAIVKKVAKVVGIVVLGLFMLTVILGMAFSNDDETVPAKEPKQGIESSEVVDPAVERKLEERDTTEPEEPEEEEPAEEVKALTDKEVVDIFKQKFAGQYDYCEIYMDDAKILYVNITNDGIAMDLWSCMQANDLTKWEKLKYSLEGLSKAMDDYVVKAGRDDIVVNLNLLNDLNTDNTFLSVMSGYIYYDVVEAGDI